jgi:5-methylcytosine-specific restriction enzyme A
MGRPNRPRAHARIFLHITKNQVFEFGCVEVGAPRKNPDGTQQEQQLRSNAMRGLSPRPAALRSRLTPPAKRAAPIYTSPEWRALLAAIVKHRGRRCEDPRCDVAGGRTDGVIYGDHIVEIKDGGALLDPQNIMLRCARCHGRKTVAERRYRTITGFRR